MLNRKGEETMESGQRRWAVETNTVAIYGS